MKKYIFIAFSLTVFFGYSQIRFDKKNVIELKAKGTSKLSLSTQQLINENEFNKEGKSTNNLIRITLKYKEGCRTMLDDPIFENTYNYKGNIVTVSIKKSNLEKLEEFECLIYADVGQKMEPQIDSARNLTNVDEVHFGSGLNESYTGNGVIIGIIDDGFHYTHDNFKDNNGDLRITRVWERTNDSGTPPTELGFDYGSEYLGSDEILSKLYDRPDKSHGTHVAGIAAGTGNALELRGIAPEAEIVLVSGFNSVISPFAGYVNNTFIDGIEYLRNYAESVNKPLVVNMSFGTNLGPHDGSTLQEEIIDNLSNEQGLVIVAAAGNDGSKLKHVQLDLINEEEPLFLLSANNNFFYNNSEDFGGLSTSYIDFWGDNNGVNSSFEITFGIFNTTTGTLQSEDYTINVNANHRTDEPIKLIDIDCDICTEDIWEVSLFSEINPLNNRPHLLLSVKTNNDDFDDYLIFQVTSDETVVHSWCRFSEFYNPDLYNFIEGDDLFSVYSPANASGVIAVGSYNPTSEDSYGKGDISSFSSIGPRIDNLGKPNITAPGSSIISSVSSFDSNYDMNNIEFSFDNNSYAKMSGTSMASPVVAGIAALWLEAKPDLSTNEVMNLMQNTAINDVYTEDDFSTPNIIWGYGKVDALAGLIEIEGLLNTLNFNENSLDVTLTPNPTSSLVSFDNSKTEFESLEIFNLLGQSLFTTELESPKDNTVDMSSYEDGIYLFRFLKEGRFFTTKVIKD